ncbi:MAG: endonuclease/exonuclease/phosphatase family protein, partial [Hyphomicrobium sp.]|nr:endonuclease/exonuclease/phosphatase family protein [Hyphomicrobium sp.]
SFGNAIVSRWPILWSRGVMLPKVRLANTFDLQRGYIEAVVMAPTGPLRVYSTHLSHVGAQQRLPQVAALLDAVNRAPVAGGTWDATAGQTFMFQEPAPAVPASAIVAGDFNFTLAHPEYPLVCGDTSPYGRLGTAMHLADAWIAASNSEEEVDSFPREGRIDHVFVTHDLAPKVRKAWIDYGTNASDHWPVFAEFDL